MSDPSTPAPDGSTQTSYSPPTEPRTQWAPQGWAQQTPPHWFEPIPGQPDRRRRQRRSTGYVVALFLVALLGSLVGSGLTYAVLLSTGQIGAPVANAPGSTATPLVAPSVTPAPITDDRSSITAAAEAVSPAVVTITVQSGAPTDPLSLPETGIGSGIIYDAAGWILTNRHVVADATSVNVELHDGREVPGTVYGIDTLTDLAIVKIDENNLTAAPIGDSASLKPGQTAIVIGAALGTFTDSVTSGVISALGRSLSVTDPITQEQRDLHNLVQTDAAINPGNSGGPLVDINGQVVGVSTAYAQGAQGIFFAIPINIAKPIMRQATAGEPLTRPWIGIIYVALNRNLATQNGLPVDYGAWLSPDTATGEPAVMEDSPAQASGLHEGDIVTAIDGRRIDASNALDDILSQYSPGDRLTLSVLRGGEELQIGITLGVRPAGLD